MQPARGTPTNAQLAAYKVIASSAFADPCLD